MFLQYAKNYYYKNEFHLKIIMVLKCTIFKVHEPLNQPVLNFFLDFNFYIIERIFLKCIVKPIILTKNKSLNHCIYNLKMFLVVQFFFEFVIPVSLESVCMCKCMRVIEVIL